MIFFTADTHFNHANIIRYCGRPFSSTDEMNAAMIENWNDAVKPRDTVYHLGDFGFGGIEDVLRKLNGKIILIVGSHDQAALKFKDRFKEVARMMEIAYQKQHIVLCHYAMRTWRNSHRGSWHLYGHSHGTLPDDPRSLSLDIGVDCHDFRPLNLNEVADIISRKREALNDESESPTIA